MQKVARTLYYLTIAATVVAGVVLIPKVGLTLFGTLFAFADAAGAPNATGFGFFDVAREFVNFLWLGNAPLLELLGILIVSLVATHISYKKQLYIATTMVAAVLLVAAVPFARAEIYFSTSGASLPLFASGVDTLSYRTLSTNSHVEGRYAADKNHVYCSSGQILANADPKTFVTVAGQGAGGSYGMDAKHVWWDCTEIPNADPATFSVIDVVPQGVMYTAGGMYAKDSRAVYFQGAVINGADPKSYEILSDWYQKDNIHVWRGANLIQGADSATFQVLKKDSNCYLNQQPSCPPDAQDNKYLYLHGQIVGKVH